jgi:hypothetical protein
MDIAPIGPILQPAPPTLQPVDNLPRKRRGRRPRPARAVSLGVQSDGITVMGVFPDENDTALTFRDTQ